ncbi:uncharacterized protein LOC132719016 [Ruditapes philippinarum]|uniref:uncharacterized protein LOC132719016 n=1 Tax=Ruditapes philippinarum TaxID=129788 RepID=UPI00295B21C0|nr:uncharacterized protein LOC132719016 [Ruditapes philippinarum]
MATIDNERHIRYMLLLHEGGILVLREILRIETTKAGKPLGNILSANEAVLKRKMDKQTYSNVFGSGGNQDIDTWDISLLATMILHLFENSVPGDIKKCIRDLKDLRNNVAHSPSLSLSSEEYENNRKNLAAILMKMCVGVDRMVYDKCQNLIKDVAVGPIDIRSALERVEELKKCDKVIHTLLESYFQKMEEVSIKVDAVSNEMEGNSIKMADISSKVEVISAEMNDVSTKVEDVTAKVDDVATKMNDVSTIHAIVEGNSATLQRIFSTVEELKDVAKEVSSVANEAIVSEMFSEMSSDVEANLRKYRHEFEKRIKDPSIVYHLAAQSVISKEISSRITDLYIVGETIKASKELIDAVMNSKEPGKWQSFVESIERADYPYLKQLLLSPTAYDQFSSTHAQRNICLFSSRLVNSISAVELLPEFIKRGVLNHIDSEVTIRTDRTKGNTYAAMILLDKMQCRKSPQEWYYEFLDLLMEMNFQHILNELEPDFIENPSAFMPNLGNNHS